MKKSAFSSELGSLLLRHADGDGETKTAINGVSCFCATTPDIRVPTVYNASLCIIAQGSKLVYLEDQIHRYTPADYLVVSVDLPVIGQVTAASPEIPYLCLKIDLDLYTFSDLLMHAEPQESTNADQTLGLFVGQLDPPMTDSVIRLARLLDTPEDIPVMAPLIQREIHYRLLRSDYAATIAQLSLKESRAHGIATVIQKMKLGFREALRIEDLAASAGMSISSFHTHFKNITAMSPLQYLKRLRLIEARQLMLAHEQDVSSTAYAVGYESVSQFSREYARMFGTPPATDTKNLRRMSLQLLQNRVQATQI